MDTKSHAIADAFNHYLISHQSSDHLVKVVNLLLSGGLTRKAFDNLGEDLGLQHSPAYKEELLDLILFYIEYCLKDHAMTSEETLSVHQLKLLFRIEEGDFYKFKWKEVKELLASEMGRILDDKSVNQSEALHQADLQRAFDLSYDQYLELTKEQIEKIVDDLCDQITADEIVTDEERGELLQKLIVLDSVFRLSAKQKKIIFRG